jgi:hypothetical protein
MTAVSFFLDTLERAATRAAAAEDEVRRQLAEQIKFLERERAFAYRRLNLMRAVVEAITGTEDEESAVATATATLRNRLGWSDDSEARTEVLSRFTPVARQVFASLVDADEGVAEPADVNAALATFESWYREAHCQAFWILFENQIPDTPLVDF